MLRKHSTFQKYWAQYQVIAESVHDFFTEESNREIVSRLKAAGLKFDMGETPQKLSDGLEGKTIVITGNFSISRDEMKALIAAHGGKNSGSISGKTAFLLAGEKAGPEKLKKADSLGIRVLSEEEFMDIIGGSGQAESADSENGIPASEGVQLSLF